MSLREDVELIAAAKQTDPITEEHWAACWRLVKAGVLRTYSVPGMAPHICRDWLREHPQ